MSLLKAYCRLCADLKPLSELTNSETDSEICEKINVKLSRINADMDLDLDLPRTFCIECLNSLNSAFKFVNKVQKSQDVLKELVCENEEKISFSSPDSPLPFESGDDSQNLNEINKECVNENVDTNVEENSEPNKIEDRKRLKLKDRTWNDVVWKCVYCGYTYSSRTDLIVHMMQNHYSCNIYICNECSTKKRTLNSFIYHIQTIHSPNLSITCYVCNTKFKTVPKLLKHLKVHISFDHVCNGCNSGFETVDELNKHKDVFFRHNVSTNSMALNIETTWEDYSWKCVVCEQQFPTSDELISHSIQMHKRCNAFSCINCPKQVFKLDKFIKHVQQQHRRSFIRSCYKCFESFHSLKQTNQHRKVHRTSEHTCEGCNTCFATTEEMAKHKESYRKHHKLATPKEFNQMFEGLTCLVCYKRLANKFSLRTHVLAHLNRTKDYVCDQCGKQFYSKLLLQEHKISHSDDRPFQCQICNKTYKARGGLLKHIKNTHCDKVQLNFTCHDCGKFFRKKWSLEQHMKVHIDNFPWVCEVCSKAFKRKVFLDRHKQNHTGVIKFSCDACQHDFFYKSNYNKHMIRIHKIDARKKKSIQPRLDDSMLKWKEEVCKPLKRGKIPKNKLDVNVSVSKIE